MRRMMIMMGWAQGGTILRAQALSCQFTGAYPFQWHGRIDFANICQVLQLHTTI